LEAIQLKRAWFALLSSRLVSPTRWLTNQIQESIMKTLLTVIFIGGVLATPAFAQSGAHVRRDAPGTYQLQASPRVHVYGAEVPQGHWRENAGPNRDFQLGDSEE
jgi:hypothetical protein